MKLNKNSKILACSAILIGVAVLVLLVLPDVYSTSYSYGIIAPDKNITENVDTKVDVEGQILGTYEPGDFSNIPVTHLETPEPVKALYISSWVASSNKLLTNIVSIIDTTELNAIVIDIKDSTGRVSFAMNDPIIVSGGSVERRIKNIRELINLLHSKNIYVIGRVSVFQDPYMTKKKPEWAIKRKSDGEVWKDRKGLSFLDPANKQVWEYTLAIVKESYENGFDEINLDYIRYPSDGNIKDINYQLTESEKRADKLKDFFQYISTEAKKEKNIKLSADIFGLTTVNTDDLGIGQVLENTLPYFDYVAPMVYPSHYASGWGNFKNPAAHPYDVVYMSMSKAVERAKASGQPIAKLRPWLQDFDMGAVYNKDMVRAQIRATYDSGLTSWMLWDPANKYTKEALEITKQ